MGYYFDVDWFVKPNWAFLCVSNTFSQEAFWMVREDSFISVILVIRTDS